MGATLIQHCICETHVRRVLLTGSLRPRTFKIPQEQKGRVATSFCFNMATDIVLCWTPSSVSVRGRNGQLRKRAGPLTGVPTTLRSSRASLSSATDLLRASGRTQQAPAHELSLETHNLYQLSRTPASLRGGRPYVRLR